MNILNDISKVYLEQVVDEGKVELKDRNKTAMQRHLKEAAELRKNRAGI
mgnify:CR=1 FL=1